MDAKKTNLKPRGKVGSLVESLPFDDENRIDWERKRKNRVPQADEVLPEVDTLDDLDEEILITGLPLANTANGKLSDSPDKKKDRKKRRHLEMDEDSGRVVLKRRRKQNRDFDSWHEDL